LVRDILSAWAISADRSLAANPNASWASCRISNSSSGRLPCASQMSRTRSSLPGGALLITFGIDALDIPPARWPKNAPLECPRMRRIDQIGAFDVVIERSNGAPQNRPVSLWFWEGRTLLRAARVKVNRSDRFRRFPQCFNKRRDRIPVGDNHTDAVLDFRLSQWNSPEPRHDSQDL